METKTTKSTFVVHTQTQNERTFNLIGEAQDFVIKERKRLQELKNESIEGYENDLRETLEGFVSEEKSWDSNESINNNGKINLTYRTCRKSEMRTETNRQKDIIMNNIISWDKAIEDVNIVKRTLIEETL